MRRNSSRRRVATRPLPLGELALAGLYLCVAVLLAAAATGCSCSQDADLDQQAAEAKKKLEEKKKQERKPSFEFKPSNAQPLPSDERPNIFIKPGHWITVSQGMRANHFNFDGEASWTPISSDAPVALDRTGYCISMSRPLYLAKNQNRYKNIEMTLFAPASGTQQTRFKFDLAERGGRTSPQATEFFVHLDDQTYFMVVLAREPDRYFFLHDLDSIKPPTVSEFSTSDSTTYYHVLRPKVDQRVPLPSSVLTWTSIAYVLWDDLDPGRLNREQQQAMIDWLHWGGQILISGPESLDKLKGSFLEPYLPVSSAESDKLSGEDFDRINAMWTQPYEKIRNRKLEAKAEPWSAVLLDVKEDAASDAILASSPDGRTLVVERQVGRGRVVVTAFRLRERDLRTWPGFDNFFNACLLRRPSRAFGKPADFEDAVQINWSRRPGGPPRHRLDPSFVTAVRFFSRDAGYRYQPYRPVTQYDELGNEIDDMSSRPAGPGLGGWSDFNAVSNAARDTIREAAGVEIPTPSFVATVLFFYLMILVPLNWTVFRLINRIELAWVAAPVISLAGAALVIQLADLNIGFARSATEVAVVEVQESYSRAHVTRYTAVYTSLSTPYSVELADADAQVQPFALRHDFRPESGTTPPTVHFQRSNDKVTLTGFHVDSNSTGLMHSEQFVDLGGQFVLLEKNGQVTGVVNHTNFDFEHAFLVFPKAKAKANSNYEFMRIGDLLKGRTAGVVYDNADLDEFIKNWVLESSSGRELNLTNLVRLAASCEGTTEEVRLVAVNYSDPLPGMTITPTASQRRSATILVANLKYSPRPDPGRDENVPWDFAKPQSHTVRPDGQEGDGTDPDGDEGADTEKQAGAKKRDPE